MRKAKSYLTIQKITEIQHKLIFVHFFLIFKVAVSSYFLRCHDKNVTTCIYKFISNFCRYFSLENLICINNSYALSSLPLKLSNKNEMWWDQPLTVTLCSCHLECKVTFCFLKSNLIYSFTVLFSFLSDKNSSRH